MITENADKFRPVAPPRIIENAYTEEQHRRLRIRAAMESTSVSELVRARLQDIIEPEAEFMAATAPR